MINIRNCHCLNLIHNLFSLNIMGIFPPHAIPTTKILQIVTRSIIIHSFIFSIIMNACVWNHEKIYIVFFSISLCDCSFLFVRKNFVLITNLHVNMTQFLNSCIFTFCIRVWCEMYEMKQIYILFFLSDIFNGSSSCVQFSAQVFCCIFFNFYVKFWQSRCCWCNILLPELFVCNLLYVGYLDNDSFMKD